MRKKLLAITLCVMVAVSCMPTMAFATSGTECIFAGYELSKIEDSTNPITTVTNDQVKTYLKNPLLKGYVAEYQLATHDADGYAVFNCQNQEDGYGCTETHKFVIEKTCGTETKTVEMTVADYITKKSAQAGLSTHEVSELKNRLKDKCYIEAVVCEECGALVREIAKDHVFEKDGCKTEVVCSHAGCTEVGTPTNPDSHDYATVSNVATATAHGTITNLVQKCTVCGDTKTTSTAAFTDGVTHLFGTPVANATVTNVDELTIAGNYVGKIKTTDASVSVYYCGKYISADENTWYEANGETTADPTTGAVNYTLECTAECGYKLVGGPKVEATKHTHTWTTVTTAATCTEPSYEALYCEECGLYKAVADASNDDAEGIATFTDVKTQVANGLALGHNFVITKHDATCTESAYYTVECTRKNNGKKCNACENIGKIYAEKFDATTKASKWLHYDSTTYTVTVSDTRTASSDIEIPYIEANATKLHTWEKVEIEATCEHGTLVAYKCTVCGKYNIHEATEVAGTKLGHDYSVVAKEETCTNEAFMVCSRCGKLDETSGKAIEGGAHSFTTWKTILAPTAFDAGYEVLCCAKCGEIKGAEQLIYTIIGQLTAYNDDADYLNELLSGALGTVELGSSVIYNGIVISVEDILNYAETLNIDLSTFNTVHILDKTAAPKAKVTKKNGKYVLKIKKVKGATKYVVTLKGGKKITKKAAGTYKFKKSVKMVYAWNANGKKVKIYK